MPDNIARLIEVKDNRVDWIKEMFSRWENADEKLIDIIVQDANLELNKIVPPATWGINIRPDIRVERWDIFVLWNSNPINIRSYIYANINGEAICVWETDSYHYDNGKQMGVFAWKKWTKLEWVRKKFPARTVDERHDDFKRWILEELSKLYPNDYDSQTVQNESYSWITSSEICFNYFRDFWKNRFLCNFSIEWQTYQLTPIVQVKGRNKIVNVSTKSKWWIAWNQFWNLVVWKDSDLLSAVWKMIEEFIKVLNWNHSWIKRNWNTKDFQDIARSFQKFDI